MMFKVISMHSKPCKHAKYNEILTNTLKKHDFSKNLSFGQESETPRSLKQKEVSFQRTSWYSLYLACLHGLLCMEMILNIIFERYASCSII